MIKSMTGFGRAEAHDGTVVYRVEVRAVNNKFLKIHSRIQDLLSFYESDVEQVVKQYATRGSVYIAIECLSADPRAEYEFNMDALRSYHGALQKIHRELGSNEEVPILELVNLPGVLQKTTESVEDTEGVRQKLTELLKEALDGMRGMREAEGANLQKDVEQRCRLLQELLARVRERAPKAVAEYRERLTSRIAEMLKPTGTEIDNQDFYREVAIFAERSDVAEEISRIESHVEQLLSSMESPDPVGRKLEFIAQEMFREANTMAAKANDAEMARTVVDVKGEVDRIREQIANVE